MFYVSELVPERKLNWAVVAAVNICEYLGVFNTLHKPIRHNKIVNAPADVLFARVKAVRPPRIYSLSVGIEAAECIGKACCEKFGELAAFFI